MSKAYKIKPLEWITGRTDIDGRTALHSGHYHILPVANNRWGWQYDTAIDWVRKEVKTLEEAKAKCEDHRRRNIELELECLEETLGFEFIKDASPVR